MQKRNLKTDADKEDFRAFCVELKRLLDGYIFLKWKNKRTDKMVKKLYKDGYSLAQIKGFVILSN